MIPTWNMKKGWTVYTHPRGTQPAPRLVDTYYPTKSAALAAATKKEPVNVRP